ncbi:MAG: ATP-dependent zinc metalloprotease FtsH [Candidatus Yonathbacteria bacterium]|nr:ATP-dependent zinc metalloprotease FtsH [Candidatus Yonathbacteria bacterium]
MSTNSPKQSPKSPLSPRGSGKKGTKKVPATGPQFINNLIGTVLIFAIIIATYAFLSGTLKDAKTLTLSELAADVVEGKVSSIVVEGDGLTVTLKDDETVYTTKKETETSLSATLANYGVTPEQLGAVSLTVKNEEGLAFWLINILPFLLPVVFLGFLVWYMSRQVKGAGMQAMSFGQSNARMIDPNDKNQQVRFKDVAGVKEAKEELTEIVDFLKNPKKFLDIGARVPKGVLLMGAPGTGKTLLARAVAGEANVPFFIISGSEFVEMFVGVGASRVRDLFKMAKKAAPAIIFIDEIDAVGRARGAGMGGGNDEREQTLNQILVEMDGFEPQEKVIVMAATNRPDVLDPALLRPGRFDRRVVLDLPDRADREEILGIHARKKPLAEDVNLKVIAERTPGFSGADLYSLMNEGAILAAREIRTQVSQFDLIRSIEKVMLGPERKSRIISAREKKITACHEAGHAIVASVLPDADPVHKISIIARGHAGGYTLKLPIEEKKLQSRKEFLDDLAVSLGGYAAEEMNFGDVTTGPSHDLAVAAALARDMVTRYGMSEALGPVAFEGRRGRIIFGSEGGENDYSEQIAAKIDAEVSAMITRALKRAEDAIGSHKSAFDAVVNRLLDAETIEHEEFERILVAHGITPKKIETIDDVIVPEV